MSEENILTEFTAFLNKSAMLTPAPLNTSVALGQPASRQADVPLPPPPAAAPKPATAPGEGLSKASH